MNVYAVVITILFLLSVCINLIGIYTRKRLYKDVFNRSGELLKLKNKILELKKSNKEIENAIKDIKDTPLNNANDAESLALQLQKTKRRKRKH